MEVPQYKQDTNLSTLPSLLFLSSHGLPHSLRETDNFCLGQSQGLSEGSLTLLGVPTALQSVDYWTFFLSLSSQLIQLQDQQLRAISVVTDLLIYRKALVI